MKRFLIFTLLILNPLNASETLFKIYGTVTDASTFAPLAGANIFIEGSNQGAAADEKGLFNFQVNGITGIQTLITSYVGYYDYRLEVNYPLTEDLKIDIPLKESALKMDQIVVTGTRTERMLKHSPVTTQVISEEKIKTSGASNLAEVLNRVTGVSVANNSRGAGASTVELQGFGSNRVLVLVDGVKMIGRVEGKLDISQIPASQIQQIEIVKGATSTLYGSEAMGGVLNIITKKPGKGFMVNTSTQVGSYGKLNANFDFGSTFLGLTQQANVSYRRSDGFDLVDSTAIQDGPSFNKYQGGLKLKKEFNEKDNLLLTLNYFQEEQRSLIDSDNENILDNSNFAGRVGFEMYATEEVKLAFGIEYSNYHHKIIESALRYENEDLKSKNIENLTKADLLFDWDLETENISQNINGGYSLEFEDIKTDRLRGNDKKYITLHNFFLQDEIKIGMFNFSPGLRLDAHSEYGTELSPKLAIMVSPRYNLRLRASYGHGFRAPSFKELYINFNHSQYGYRIDGNPDLMPERSESLNLGAEFWTEKNYHTRINIFFNDITNHITTHPVDTSDSGLVSHVYANISGAQTWGMEWDMEYYPFDWFETGMGYYYLGSKDEFTNHSLPLNPKHRANFRFAFKLPMDMKLAVTTQYSDKKFYYPKSEDGDYSRVWVEGFVQIHSNLRLKLFDNYSINFGIKNLTDYVNKKIGPMPGREFYATLNTNF